MEMINEDGFLEELLGLRRETCSWETNNNNNNNNSNNNNASVEMNGYYSSCNNNWGISSTPLDALDSSATTVVATPSSILTNPPRSCYDDSFSTSLDPTTTTLQLDYCSNSFADFYSGHLLGPDPTPIPGPGDEDYYPPTMGIMDQDDNEIIKAEPSSLSSTNNNDIITGLCMEINNNNNNKKSGSKVKKVEGQPSKNLMAERRRRKRLNDRLSMLRSVVPKISKMDRTSILGDTIDYMKELLEKINNLQEEADVGSSNQFNVMTIFKDVDNNKPNDVLVRNSPKFDVERRNLDTRVEICCAGKPGLLLSTVTTLEALGLEIQQCVISCFNDFSLQASCSEEMEHRSVLDSEDIKQALFRNAGYGGRCL